MRTEKHHFQIRTMLIRNVACNSERGIFQYKSHQIKGLAKFYKAKRIYAKVFSGRTVFGKSERFIYSNLWILFHMNGKLKTADCFFKLVDCFSKSDWLAFWTKPLKFADCFLKLAGWLKHCERKIENGRLFSQIGKKIGTLRKAGFWFFSLARGKQFSWEKEGF